MAVGKLSQCWASGDGEDYSISLNLARVCARLRYAVAAATPSQSIVYTDREKFI